MPCNSFDAIIMKRSSFSKLFEDVETIFCVSLSYISYEHCLQRIQRKQLYKINDFSISSFTLQNLSHLILWVIYIDNYKTDYKVYRTFKRYAKLVYTNSFNKFYPLKQLPFVIHNIRYVLWKNERKKLIVKKSERYSLNLCILSQPFPLGYDSTYIL